MYHNSFHSNIRSLIALSLSNGKQVPSWSVCRPRSQPFTVPGSRGNRRSTGSSSPESNVPMAGVTSSATVAGALFSVRWLANFSAAATCTSDSLASAATTATTIVYSFPSVVVSGASTRVAIKNAPCWQPTALPMAFVPPCPPATCLYDPQASSYPLPVRLPVAGRYGVRRLGNGCQIYGSELERDNILSGMVPVFKRLANPCLGIAISI